MEEKKFNLRTLLLIIPVAILFIAGNMFFSGVKGSANFGDGNEYERIEWNVTEGDASSFDIEFQGGDRFTYKYKGKDDIAGVITGIMANGEEKKFDFRLYNDTVSRGGDNEIEFEFDLVNHEE